MSKLFGSSLAKIFSRNLNTITSQQNVFKNSLISPQSSKSFENILPTILNKVSTENFIHPNVTERVKKIAEYIAYEEKFCGPLAIYAYESLEKPENITEETLNQIQTLAWGAELIHAYFMIVNDLYKSPERSTWCTYDPSLLRSFVYEVLKTEFTNEPKYKDIAHLFDKAFFQTIVGYHLDLISIKDYNNFTTERYNSIVDLKTKFHMFEFPVALATKLIKTMDENQHKQIKAICNDFGRLYNIQTDFLYCYGEEIDQFGIPKHSWDIQRGKCSWLAVTALKRCSPAQRTVFTTCYGSKEPAHIERIKLLYDQMKMPKLYEEQKEKLCENIVKKVNLSGMDLFLKVLNLIKNRDRTLCKL